MKIKANSPATGKDGLDKQNTNKKSEQLDAYRSDATEQALTTNQGVKISDNQNSLKAGVRGATLIEDFILREKITHFDHERIPERIVHARGVGAHGYFEAYPGNEKLTKAGFLIQFQPGSQGMLHAHCLPGILMMLNAFLRQI